MDVHLEKRQIKWGAVVFFRSRIEGCRTTLVPQSPMGTGHGVHLILFTMDNGLIVVNIYRDGNLLRSLRKFFLSMRGIVAPRDKQSRSKIENINLKEM